MTNAEAWFNNSLHPRKPDGSLDEQPTATSTLTQLLNYETDQWLALVLVVLYEASSGMFGL